MAGLTGVAEDDSTTCDCMSLHTKKLDAASSSAPDDCAPGLVCVNAKCKQICLLAAGVACANRQCSNPLYNSTRYGYCD